MKGLPPLTEVKSSNIEAVGHRGTELFIRFKGGGLYSYDGVPSEVYHELVNAPSPGSVFRAKVRGIHKHKQHDGQSRMASLTAVDAGSRTMAKKRRWMSKAVKPENKGKFTRKAEAAGESVHEYAEEKKGAGGTLGKEANLALTFEKTARRRKMYDNPRSR